MTRWGRGESEPDRILHLQDEVDQLKEAVASHAGSRPTRAGRCSRRSPSTPTSGRATSLILVRGRTGDMPDEIRTELGEALERYGPTQIPGAPPAG